MLTPEQTSLRASAAALTRWSKEDTVAGTQAMRDGRMQRYIARVQEAADHGLSDDEALRRAERLRNADLKFMSLKAARLRSQRARLAEAERVSNELIQVEVAIAEAEAS